MEGGEDVPKDKTETHVRIVRCMREEFLAHGYEKASLNRVSARVGITTAGLYRHFANKEDMFAHLVQDTLDAFRKLADSGKADMEIDAEYNPFDFDWASAWVDFIYEHYEGMKLLICCSKGSPFESFEEDLIQMEAEGNRAYVEALRRAGKRTKGISDMQWHMLSTAYVHLLFEAVRHDMTKDEAMRHARFVSDLLYPGWRRLFELET